MPSIVKPASCVWLQPPWNLMKPSVSWNTKNTLALIKNALENNSVEYVVDTLFHKMMPTELSNKRVKNNAKKLRFLKTIWNYGINVQIRKVKLKFIVSAIINQKNLNKAVKLICANFVVLLLLLYSAYQYLNKL